jgi:hypothetical protein
MSSATIPRGSARAAQDNPEVRKGFSHIAEADEESVEELADTDQAFERAAVEGIKDATDHAARPTHTHEEYGRPDQVPPRKKSAWRLVQVTNHLLPLQHHRRTVVTECGFDNLLGCVPLELQRHPALIF